MLTILCLLFFIAGLVGLFSGEPSAMIAGALVAALAVVSWTTYNSGKNWLYKRFAAPETRIALPNDFSNDFFGNSMPYCSYLTTTTGPEGSVIEEHGYQPFVVNTILHLCVPQGTEWANDPWIQQLNQYSIFYISPNGGVLEQWRFSKWTESQTVMMDAGFVFGEQRTKNAYYFEVTEVVVEYQ